MFGFIWVILGFFILHSPSYAAEDCTSNCRSELLRVDIAANALEHGAADGLLPALKKLSESPTLHSAIEKGFPVPAIGFPQSKEICSREKKEGDPNFQNIDCDAPGLCSDTNLDPSVREKICFKLPCPVLEGSLNTGKCDEAKDIYPVGISFPGTVDIQKIDLTPTKIDFKNKEASLCFKLNALNVKMNASLALDISKTSLPDKSLDITNINPVLDSPRDICINAHVDITSSNPVSQIKLVPQGSDPVISDQMIKDAAQKLNISGLSGYPPEDLKTIQSEIVPVIFQPIRSSVESALEDSLGKVFEAKIKELIGPISSSKGKSSLTVDSRNFMSELGIGNMMVKNQLAILECAQLKAAKKEIPPKHACIGLEQYGVPITQDFDGSTFNAMLNFADAAKNQKITSESIKQRLIALKALMLEAKPLDFMVEGLSPEARADYEKSNIKSIKEDIKEYIDPIIDSISNAQLEQQLYNFVEIQNQLTAGQTSSVGLMLPEICTPKPSPHANKKMPGCPIQVYVDLNEFNQVLGKMWDSGRMCMKGRGAYIPERDNYGYQSYTDEGAPIAKGGCYLSFQGMGCYIKAPPKISYNSKLRKYQFSLSLQSCYRGPVIFGLGKVGGDFNIKFSFDPKACNNGDFCMEKPKIDWSVVKGTERFAMRESSFFRSMVDDKLNEAVSNAVKETIRIPLASGVGPLADVPLQAEGRVDSGPGYFGACLEIQKEAKPE